MLFEEPELIKYHVNTDRRGFPNKVLLQKLDTICGKSPKGTCALYGIVQLTVGPIGSISIKYMFVDILNVGEAN